MSEMFKIELDDQAVKDMLQELAQKADDLSPFMRKVAGILHDAVEENFEQEGRPKWKALSPSRIKQREKKGYWPGKILQASGQLASSISQQSGRDFALVGTNKKYAGVHQEGYNKPVTVWGHVRRQKSRDVKQGRKIVAKGIAIVKDHARKMNIPARPFLKVTDGDLQKILEAGKEYLMPR